MFTKAEKIKLIVLDVDGTMTDGTIYLDNNGIETKGFNVKDGFAIANAIKEGINVAIITGRKSRLVEKRAEELGIQYVFQGIHNKVIKLNELLNELGLSYEETAYIGDDINCKELLSHVGFAACPANAQEQIKNISGILILNKCGGDGAVREFIELLIKRKFNGR